MKKLIFGTLLTIFLATVAWTEAGMSQSRSQILPQVQMLLAAGSSLDPWGAS